jgi:hypothetical protein
MPGVGKVVEDAVSQNVMSVAQNLQVPVKARRVAGDVDDMRVERG